MSDPLFSGAPNFIQGGVLAPPGYQSPLMNYQPGYYSDLAYKMAGSPAMGPSATTAAPSLLYPTGTGGSSGSSGANALGALQTVSQLSKLYGGASGVLNPPATTVSPAVNQQLSDAINGQNGSQINYSSSGAGSSGGVLDAAPAAAPTTGLLAAPATPSGTIAIYDEAGNLVSGGTAADAAASGAAGSGTATGASGSASGTAGAGTAALAAALFAAQYQLFANDSVGSPESQSKGWVSSLDGNPQWQPLVDAAKSYMAQNGGKLDQNFWASQGVNFNSPIPSGQPEHRNALG